jgi:putative transposase
MDLKEESVIRAQKGNQSFSSLCSEYGISRKTGYKWVSRFTEDGFVGFENQTTRAKSSPERLAEEVVCRLVRLKQAHMAWGPKKIHGLYLRTSEEPISSSSVKRVLKASGLVQEQKKRRPVAEGRLNERHEALAPNHVWSVGVKGWWYAKDRSRFEPLTVRDEYSCYILEARMLGSTKTEAVREAFERLFALYGLPRVIKSDNGTPFASAHGLRG